MLRKLKQAKLCEVRKNSPYFQIFDHLFFKNLRKRPFQALNPHFQLNITILSPAGLGGL